MSYDIYLSDDKGTVEVPVHQEGGTFCAMSKTQDPKTGKWVVTMGTAEASLNVTYNYSNHFHFRFLHGRTAKEVIILLEYLVKQLGTERSKDYWESTPGNAGHAINILLSWAKQHPDATFQVY